MVGVNSGGSTFLRPLSKEDPIGKWHRVSGTLTQVDTWQHCLLQIWSRSTKSLRNRLETVGRKSFGTNWNWGWSHHWVDASGHVWYRWGLSPSQPFGKGWKTTVGSFKHISANERMIAGVEYGGSEVFFCHANTFPHSWVWVWTCCSIKTPLRTFYLEFAAHGI